MPQHIIVCDYQPAWQQAYRAEAQKIRAILGENLVCIHHIGSTAVPGLAAKPVIDILPVVRSLAQADAAAPAFAAIGYEYLGEFGIAGTTAAFLWRPAKAATPAPIRSTYLPRATREILPATWLSAIICGHMRRSGNSMHSSSGRSRCDSHTTSRGIVRARKPLSSGSSGRRSTGRPALWENSPTGDRCGFRHQKKETLFDKASLFRIV